MWTSKTKPIFLLWPHLNFSNNNIAGIEAAKFAKQDILHKAHKFTWEMKRERKWVTRKKRETTFGTREIDRISNLIYHQRIYNQQNEKKYKTNTCRNKNETRGENMPYLTSIVVVIVEICVCAVFVMRCLFLSPLLYLSLSLSRAHTFSPDTIYRRWYIYAKIGGAFFYYLYAYWFFCVYF